jgi:hypothetical protein
MRGAGRMDRGYAATVAKRKRRACRPGPDPGVLLAQLRSPEEQVRVKALHRVCSCGASFVVYERFRGDSLSRLVGLASVRGHRLQLE